MSAFPRTGLFVLVSTLCACVTVNVYFPAAAAEEAADQIIEDVWGEELPSSSEDPAVKDSSAPGGGESWAFAGWMLSWVVSDAEAAKPNLNVNTPEIAALRARMEKRFRDLRKFYDSGAIGLSNDGLVLSRDLSAVSARERKDLNRLVKDENRDRKALYKEIAVANGKPEWESDIQKTFARRWVANARSGWWSQNDKGTWVQRK